MTPDDPVVANPDASTTMAGLAGRVRALRHRAGFTLADLSAEAGIGKSTLAQIESGKANPSVETLFALSVALDVPLSDLFTSPTPQVRLVRRGEGIRLDSSDDHFHVELLAATGRRGTSEICLVEVEAGTSRVADPHPPGTVEYLLVVEGVLHAGPASDPLELGPGDLAAFDADVPHTYAAPGERVRAFGLLDYPA
jgi:transcriptional regulator with XRE-family HTH domain